MIKIKRMRRLTKDGERKTIPAQGFWKNIRGFEVDALRVDSETPYVVLRAPDGQEFFFEDCYAEELAARITAALSILPTSK